ncbi:MAG: neocarzinostatin apoprotein domain-containing protein [Acidimicrobiales bacterium]
MKRVGVGVAVAVLTLGGALFGVTVASAHQSPRVSGPVIMVQPDSGLVNGSVVSVSGSGFTQSDQPFYIIECSLPATSEANCSTISAPFPTPAPVDASGVLVATNFTVGTGKIGTSTCGTISTDLDNCIIEVGSLSNQSDAAGTPISFATPLTTTTTTTTTTVATTTTTQPKSVATPRKLKASPSTGLHNGQKVKVSGSGFKKGDHVYLVECVVGSTGQKGCDLATLKPVTVTSGGKIPTTSFKVVTGKVGNGTCGTKASNLKHCEISAGNAAGGDSAVVKVAFKA